MNQKSNFEDSQTSSLSILSLPVGEICPYDKNPRRDTHPRYEEIKNSIYQDGINQPFVVTKKPNSKKYMIFKGGNTRLIILQQLHEETNDSRFEYVECLYQPWTGSELDALVGHLNENMMRNSLCFIDRAYGIKLAIEILNEANEEKLSLRACHKILSEKGVSASLSNISVMMYAVENVEPWLPSRLCASIGRPQVQKLRTLDRAYSRVCDEFDTSKKMQLEVFRATLSSYEERDWSYNKFRRSLELAVSSQNSVSIQDISIRLDGYLRHSLKLNSKNYSAISNELDELFKANKSDRLSERSVYTVNTRKNLINQLLKGNFQVTEAYPLKKNLNPSVPSEKSVNGSRTSNSFHKETLKQNSARNHAYAKINSLRDDAHQLAWRIAKNFNIHIHSTTKQRVIEQTKSWGLGYLVVSYPPPTANAGNVRDAIWWVLVELSDLVWAVECARPYVARLTVNSEISHFVRSGNTATLCLHAKSSMNCSYPHLGLFNYCLRQLDDPSWQDLNQLIFTYRALHQIAQTSNIHLFKKRNGESTKKCQ